MSEELHKAQELLLQWLCHQDKVRYDTIKRHCAYLNEQFALQITEHPAWTIFLPLYYAGNVDYCGNSAFKVTEPITIVHGSYRLFINQRPSVEEYEVLAPSIFRCAKGEGCDTPKTYRFDAREILRHYPCVDSIVELFDDSSKNDYSNLTFDNAPKQVGVGYTEQKHYFFVYPNSRVVEIPAWDVKPDALNIAYQYSRALAERANGSYNPQTGVLNIPAFRFPIMLYRVLMVASMLEGKQPYKTAGHYIFPGISKLILKELDRILCKTIRYE